MTALQTDREGSIIIVRSPQVRDPNLQQVQDPPDRRLEKLTSYRIYYTIYQLQFFHEE
jgi:hypothetical protein